MRQVIFILVGLLMIASARAEERHGIRVYGGAILDTVETNFVQEVVGGDGYCFRTTDSVEKVSAFYRQLPGLVSRGGDESEERFVKELENGQTVYVMIASPWTAAKTGQLQEDTIIKIIKE